MKRLAYSSLIVDIEATIQNGTLKPDDRRPTHRKLACDLNLSVQTVSQAYDKLIEAGRIVGVVGRGTFVPEDLNGVAMPFVNRRTACHLLDASILRPVIDHAHENALKQVLWAIAGSMPCVVMEALRPLSGAIAQTSPNSLHCRIGYRDALEERSLVDRLQSEGVAVAAGSSFSIGSA